MKLSIYRWFIAFIRVKTDLYRNQPSHRTVLHHLIDKTNKKRHIWIKKLLRVHIYLHRSRKHRHGAYHWTETMFQSRVISANIGDSRAKVLGYSDDVISRSNISLHEQNLVVMNLLEIILHPTLILTL